MATAPRTLGIVTGMGLLVAVAACGGGSDTTTGPSETNGAASAGMNGAASSEMPADTSSPTSGSSEGGNSDTQTLVAAGQTALDEAGKGSVLALEAEENGELWEVQIVLSDGSVQEYKISGDGSEVQGKPTPEDTDADDKAENKDLVQGAELDYEKAAKKVLDARSGKITELGLDDHQVGVVWEADVHTGDSKYEVKVNAASGKIVENEADS